MTGWEMRLCEAPYNKKGLPLWEQRHEGWLGSNIFQLSMMESERLPTKVLHCSVNGGREQGRQLKKWIDNVQQDIQGGPKKVSQRNLHITSSNTSRFSKFLQFILQEICNKTVIKYPTLNASLHYLVKYLYHKTSVFSALRQSWWKMNSPES